MNLGVTIKDIRKSKGVKQIELANSCSITASYLSNIEGNRKEPTLTTLKKICDYLEIPLPILFFLSMDETDVPEEKKEIFLLIEKMMKNTIKSSFL